MVSTDIGNINSVANSYLRFEEPRSFFAPTSYRNGGYALPTIIGAKVAAPHRPAISDAGVPEARTEPRAIITTLSQVACTSAKIWELSSTTRGSGRVVKE